MGRMRTYILVLFSLSTAAAGLVAACTSSSPHDDNAHADAGLEAATESGAEARAEASADSGEHPDSGAEAEASVPEAAPDVRNPTCPDPSEVHPGEPCSPGAAYCASNDVGACGSGFSCDCLMGPGWRCVDQLPTTGDWGCESRCPPPAQLDIVRWCNSEGFTDVDGGYHPAMPRYCPDEAGVPCECNVDYSFTCPPLDAGSCPDPATIREGSACVRDPVNTNLDCVGVALCAAPGFPTFYTCGSGSTWTVDSMTSAHCPSDAGSD
jgi:hypothetical protein